MFAIIRTGGKQYRVQKGDRIRVEKLEGKDGASLNFDNVLLISDGESSTVGSPLVEGAQVKGKLVEQTRGPKITVFKRKRRQGYRRTRGHRQDLTLVEITDIKKAA